jgi:hypothetical protein
MRFANFGKFLDPYLRHIADGKYTAEELGEGLN